MEEKITSIIPMECPHCKYQIVVALETPTPVFKTVATTETIMLAKESLIESVKTLGLSEAKLIEVIEWLSREDTVILPLDIEKILDEIKEQNGITKKDKTK